MKKMTNHFTALLLLVVLHPFTTFAANCKYTLLNEWSTGFTAVITITNTEALPIDNWAVTWEYNSGITHTNSWNANISGNNPYTATAQDNNIRIEPGSSVEFIFQGRKELANTYASPPIITGDFCTTNTQVNKPSFNSPFNSRKTKTVATTLLPTLELKRIYPNVRFTQPLALIPSPTNNNRWYVIEKAGKVLWLDANDNTTSTKNTYIDLSSVVDSANEGGVLSMAFHPNYANNRQVYISLTEPVGTSNTMRSAIVRYTEKSDGTSLDANSRQTVLTLNQPYKNHNGGQIDFGPDGFLYIGFGDGGSANDPQNNSQNLSNWHGSMLRIDVNSGSPYSVPSDNPFVNTNNVLPEIFAYGLRNPWRWSFDKSNGELWVGDVGQSAFEEVNIITAGKNYGWRCKEGTETTSNSCTTNGPYTPPIEGYNHSEGQSITGGYIYRGTAITDLVGVYILGDYINGKIWTISKDSSGNYQRALALDSNLLISSFGQSNNGEIYVVDYKNGELYQITSNNSSPTNNPPIASASATPQEGDAGVVVTFNGSGSSDPDGDTLTYQWNFGDNTSGAGANVSHTYSTAGNYTATLTVSDGSLSHSASINIKVNSPSSSSQVQCVYSIVREWDEGFTASIKLSNIGPTTVKGWEVSWNYHDNSLFKEGWDAIFSGTNPYKAVNQPWNSDITPGANVKFGFNGKKGVPNTPASIPPLTGPICGNDVPSNEGKVQYATQCASCHGATGDGHPILIPLNDPDKLSTGRDIAALAAYIDTNMPTGNAGACTSACATAIANYIASTFWSDTPITETPGPRQLNALTRYEYTNTVEHLLGIKTTQITANFPVEAKVNGFNNNAKINIVTDRHVDVYLNTSDELAKKAVAENRAGLLPCDSAQPTCPSQFIDIFGKQALRRPLSTAEKNAYLTLFKTESVFDNGLRLVIRAMLNSPHFLYKSEMGEPSSGGMYKLTQYETATQLSYMFWGSLPDATLMNAADNNQLNTNTQLQAQATRLLSHANARKHMAQFVEQWLEASPADIGSKDINVFPSFTLEVRKALNEELSTFFNHVLFDSSKSFLELFNADYVFVNSTLAAYYNIPGVSGNNMQKVIDPSGKRGGLLTLGSVMAAHGHSNETAPVPRGKFVRRRVMCHQLPDPPTDIDTSFPDPDPSLTTRERFELRTAAKVCQDCHKYLNGVGFGFEGFDGAGAIRTLDNNKPVNVSASVIGLESLSGTDSTPYTGAQQLQNMLIGSNGVKNCFARQFYRFSRSYAETGTDQKTLDTLSKVFVDSNFNMQRLMIGVTQLQSFTLRSER